MRTVLPSLDESRYAATLYTITCGLLAAPFPSEAVKQYWHRHEHDHGVLAQVTDIFQGTVQ